MRNKLIVNLYKTENGKQNYHNQISWNLDDSFPSTVDLVDFLHVVKHTIKLGFNGVKGKVFIEFYHENWEKNEGEFNEIHHMKTKTYIQGIDELLEYLIKLYV